MIYPRSPYEKVGGIFHFGRMIDKIRLKAKNELHSDYFDNLGAGFDAHCTSFLQVSYDALAKQVQLGLSDNDLLEWCFVHGRRPTDKDILVWNEFMRKLGCNDGAADALAQIKRENGLEDRDDIQTFFDMIDLDEDRK